MPSWITKDRLRRTSDLLDVIILGGAFFGAMTGNIEMALAGIALVMLSKSVDHVMKEW